ncbi:MAG TPA: energy transducer TonB [Telluria sp.]|jgi:protein TonB
MKHHTRIAIAAAIVLGTTCYKASAQQAPAEPVPVVASHDQNGLSRVVAGSCKPPVYPSRSRREEQRGTVRMAFLVDKDGKVIESKIDHTSGWYLLDGAALHAFEKCTFRPELVDGVPVATWIKYTYGWTIE